MSREWHKIVPAAYLILRDGGKVLLLRRANTGYMDGMYTVPTGHVELMEHAAAAAVREAKEEVGIDVLPEDLKFVHVIYRKAVDSDHERVCFFFEAHTWSGEIKNCEPNKCDDVKWFSADDLPDNMSEEVKFMFEELSSGKNYSNFNY